MSKKVGDEGERFVPGETHKKIQTGETRGGRKITVNPSNVSRTLSETVPSWILNDIQSGSKPRLSSAQTELGTIRGFFSFIKYAVKVALGWKPLSAAEGGVELKEVSNVNTESLEDNQLFAAFDRNKRNLNEIEKTEPTGDIPDNRLRTKKRGRIERQQEAIIDEFAKRADVALNQIKGARPQSKINIKEIPKEQLQRYARAVAFREGIKIPGWNPNMFVVQPEILNAVKAGLVELGFPENYDPKQLFTFGLLHPPRKN